MRNLLEPEHLLVILLVVVVMFGGQRLPEIGAALGRGVRDFRRAADGDGLAEPPRDALRDVARDTARDTAADAPRDDPAAGAPKRLLP